MDSRGGPSSARLRRALPLGCTLIVASCGGNCFGDAASDASSRSDTTWPEAAAPAPIATLAVLPPVIHAKPGTSFQVEVEARDASGKPVPVDGGSVSWSGTGGLSVSASGLRGVVKIPTTAPTAPTTVLASFGSLNGKAEVRIAAVGTDDHVVLPDPAAAPPYVALFDAGDGGTCLGDILVPVAGEANLGRNLRSDPCTVDPEVAVFSAAHGGLWEPAPPTPLSPSAVPPWTGNRDVLQRDLPPVRVIDVKVLTLVDPSRQAEAATMSAAEIALASAIYRNGRTGIEFNITDTTTGSPLVFDKALCSDRTALANLGVNIDQKVLHVVYVDELIPDWRGWTCTHMPGDPGAALFIAWKRAPTTVAHELGHALGMDAPMPKFGHTGSDYLNLHGFDYRNVMWVGETADQPMARTLLSIGQVYRMNADRRSWLVHALGLPNRRCQCDPYDTAIDSCPLLYLDIRPVGTHGPPNPVCVADPWP